MDADEQRGWRAYGAVLVPLSLVYVALNATAQGFVVLAVALVWVLAVLLTGSGSRLRDVLVQRRRLVLGAGAGLALAATVALGAAIPVLRKELDDALVERAGLLGRSAPDLRGPPGDRDRARHLRPPLPGLPTCQPRLEHRPLDDRRPALVLLGMFSNGGLLLGLTHTAVVLVVAFVLLRGAFRQRGAGPLTIAAWAGSGGAPGPSRFVSFDVPSRRGLPALDVSSVILALSPPPPTWRRSRLPGSAPDAGAGRGGGQVR
jgi:hypothetical protein